ncbi:MAG: secondary thiamine-phosphate synthase enzyme [Methanomicrobiales archaeon HGW-Methanomicrobiales-4]|nr:MAG: secondary thiamine-phosphate synthase enzyme [Methanomicrobiales archaeon HGW-Methanomicrobiales-4]
MLQKILSCPTSGEGDIIDLTSRVQELVSQSGVMNGLCSIFVNGSTAAITTIEFEPGVLKDLNRSLSVMAPSDIGYAHDTRWGDGNGRSHVKAALVGPSLTIPILDRQMGLGTWQQIVLLELDTRARKDRKIIITVMGE